MSSSIHSKLILASTPSIRILFYMNSKTYISVIIALLFITPLTALSAAPAHAEAKEQLTPLIPGTDIPRARECGRGNAYRYNEYTIYTEPAAEEVGENIKVYRTDKRDNNPCIVRARRPLYTYDNETLGGANYFAGLYLDYLFIDQGTGPSYRGLSIYDLSTGKLQYFTNYEDPVLSDGTLTYFETVHARDFYHAKNACLHIATWTKKGLSTHYQRKTAYNLETGKKEALDIYRCGPGQ